MPITSRHVTSVKDAKTQLIGHGCMPFGAGGISTAYLQVQGRMPFKVFGRSSARAVQLLSPAGYYINSSGVKTNIPQAMVYEVAIERGDGFVSAAERVTWSAANTITINPGDDPHLSDVWVTTAGDLTPGWHYVRYNITVATAVTGISLGGQLANGTSNHKVVGWTAGGAASQVLGVGAITNSGGNTSLTFGITPFAILGKLDYLYPAVLLNGDSICEGSNNTAGDGLMNRSFYQMGCFYNDVPWVYCGRYATLASQWAGGSMLNIVKILAPYCTHFISQTGFNDVNSGRTSAQILTDRATIRAGVKAANPYIKTIECSITPHSTDASNNWITGSSAVGGTQIVVAAWDTGGVVPTFNAAIPTVADGFMDACSFMQDPVYPGIFKVQTVSGAATKITNDGTHVVDNLTSQILGGALANKLKPLLVAA